MTTLRTPKPNSQPAAGFSFVALREAEAASRRPAPAGAQPGKALWPIAAVVVALAMVAGLALLSGPSARARLSPKTATPPAIVAPVAPAAPAAPAALPGGAQQMASGPVDASRFAAGACVAFGPTTGGRHQTVYLDAGHGGPDPGALGLTQSGAALRESDLTLATEQATVSALQRLGYRVVVSRTSGAAVAVAGPGDLANGVYTAQGAENDLRARGLCANLAHAAVLVSIHFNAGGGPADAGMVTYYDDVRTFSADNLRLATLLQAQVLGSMNRNAWGIPDGRVVSDAGAGGTGLDEASRRYGRLMLLGPAAPGFQATPSEMPGAVVEPLFLTDPFEGSIAADPAGQQAIASGIAQAIDAFLPKS